MSSQESYAAYKKRKYLSRVAGKKRIKPAYLVRKNPMYRSMRYTGVHTITKGAELRMNANAAGYSFNTQGTGPSTNFCIWFTPQTAWIWWNTTNYSAVSIPGFTDISALFDEIMIDKVEITIFTGTDPTTLGSGSAQIIMAKDYNDKLAPASTGDVQQYADVKAYNMSNNFINRITVRPQFSTYSLDSAGIGQPSVSKRGYFKSTLDVEHYGIKGAFINSAPNNQTHTYQFKYYFKCKITK